MATENGASLGSTSQDMHPSGNGQKVLWAGVQSINKIFDVNVFSFVQLATFAMPALALSGAAAKVRAYACVRACGQCIQYIQCIPRMCVHPCVPA